MLAGVILFFLLISTGAFYVASRFTADVKEVGTSVVYSNLAEVARSGLHITKEALYGDPDWSDCQDANQNCSLADSYGYYPLYSVSLVQTIENYTLNDIDLSIYIKPVSANNVNVIVVAKNPNNYEKLVLGGKFNRIVATDKLPILYGGASTTVLDGEVCSYYWDSSQIVGVTSPNFSVYLNQDFYFSASILIPPQPAGPNPKDVRFFTNFSTEVRGYDVIDRLYSTGDVYLTNGAQVDYVEAGGTITTDRSSSCTVCIENSDWQYPSFNTSFPDNALPSYIGQDLTINCGAGDTTIPAGTYRSVTITGDGDTCTINITGAVNVRDFNVDQGSGNVVNLVVDPSAGQLNIQNLTVSGRNTVNIDPQGSPLRIVGDTLTVANRGNLICQDPRLCLYDFNSVSLYCYTSTFFRRSFECSDYTSTVLQGTVLARNSFSSTASTVIGNTFAETVSTDNSRMCNIVDATGTQILPSDLDFFTLISNDPSLLDPIVAIIYQTVCPSYEDCAGNL